MGNTAQAHARCCVTSLALHGGCHGQGQGQGRSGSKEGEAKSLKRQQTMEGAEEEPVVTEVCERWKEARWQPQASFMGQPTVETER